MKPTRIFSFALFASFACLGAVACSAETDASDADSSADVQDQDLKKSLTSCNVDDDCVAVPQGGCCDNGWKAAVNKHHTKAYASATKCTLHPHPMCPMYMVNDTRVAQCDGAKKQCTMVKVEDIKCGGFIMNAHQCPTGYTCSHLGVNPDVGGKCVSDAAAVEGSWGADHATLDVQQGHGAIDFDCGAASIDAFTFSDATHFTGTGTKTAGTGVQPPPGLGPKPQPATFSGSIVGSTLTLEVTASGSTSTYVFTKNRQVNLIRCL